MTAWCDVQITRGVFFRRSRRNKMAFTVAQCSRRDGYAVPFLFVLLSPLFYRVVAVSLSLILDNIDFAGTCET